MHFLTLFSIGPRTKNNFVQYEFPRNAFFVKHPSVQCTYIRKKFCDISCYVVRLITPSLHVNGHIATLCQRTKNLSDNHNVMIYILGTKNILHNNDVLNLMDFKDPVIHILLSTRKQSVFWGKKCTYIWYVLQTHGHRSLNTQSGQMVGCLQLSRRGRTRHTFVMPAEKMW